MNINEKIEEIIKTEWEMFQEVDNIGGRASCQDDPETFYIMRRSQYENWSPDMINCYFQFISECRDNGRNLVSEKYARMMAYTDPHYYNKYIKGKIPFVPASTYRLIGEIVDSLIDWEEAFAAKYPLLADTGRPVRSDGDASGFTSMETYARGELETYPVELLRLYLEYINELKASAQSLSEKNQLTMVKLYGYDSIEEAEASLR
ncbi:MAG: DUF4125 family protein [Candidatus Fimisoma sp.]